MKLLIGCPVKDRAWILPTWFHYARSACDEIGVDPHFVFVYGTSEDNTRDLLQGPHSTIIYNDEVAEGYLPHVWNDIERYQYMAAIRNQLLDMVRMSEADYFLSLDSDVLIAPGTLTNLFETIEKCDAVGGKLYMDPRGYFNPSYGNINNVNGGIHREDAEGVFRVDVIMAMKLMNPKAYNVDYVAHFQGEDVGWSLNAHYEGVKIKWDGRIASKHVMIPEMLARVDKRVGY